MLRKREISFGPQAYARVTKGPEKGGFQTLRTPDRFKNVCTKNAPKRGQQRSMLGVLDWHIFGKLPIPEGGSTGSIDPIFIEGHQKEIERLNGFLKDGSPGRNMRGRKLIASVVCQKGQKQGRNGIGRRKGKGREMEMVKGKEDGIPGATGGMPFQRKPPLELLRI